MLIRNFGLFNNGFFKIRISNRIAELFISNQNWIERLTLFIECQSAKVFVLACLQKIFFDVYFWQKEDNSLLNICVLI